MTGFYRVDRAQLYMNGKPFPVTELRGAAIAMWPSRKEHQSALIETISERLHMPTHSSPQALFAKRGQQ